MNTCSLFSPIFWIQRIASSFYNLKLKQLLGFCSIRRRIRNSSPSCFNNHNHLLLLFPDLILPDFYSKLRFFLFVFSKSASARFLPGIHGQSVHQVITTARSTAQRPFLFPFSYRLVRLSPSSCCSFGLLDETSKTGELGKEWLGGPNLTGIWLPLATAAIDRVDEKEKKRSSRYVPKSISSEFFFTLFQRVELNEEGGGGDYWLTARHHHKGRTTSCCCCVVRTSMQKTNRRWCAMQSVSSF